MNHKFKGLMKDTMIFALGNFGSKIILFFLVPLYTNYLTASEYGLAEFIFTMSQLLYPILSLCIFEGIIRIGMKNTVREENTLICAYSVWVVSCIILLLTTRLWDYYLAVAEWKCFLSLYTALHILCEIELNYLKIKEKNKLFAISCIIQTACLALLNIIFIIYQHLGVKGYLLANILSMLFEAIFIFISGHFLSDIKQGHFEMGILKNMLAYSTPLIINNIAWWVIHSSDKIMIEAMLTEPELGLYTVATKIPSLINVFINIFSQSWGITSIKEMESTNDTEFYSKVFITYSTLVIGCSILVIGLTKPFMLVYVGSGFTSAWQYVPWLIVSAVFSSIAAYFASLMGALQISKKTMETTLSGAIANIVLNYVFIKMMGIWGAIIGTVFAYLVIAILRCFEVLKQIKIEIPVFQVTINFVIVILQALCVSLNIHICITSIIALILFLINNRQNLSQLKGIIRVEISSFHRNKKQLKNSGHSH